MQYRVAWSAALYASIAAGILAMLVQIALWSIFADVLPTILFRDARFTAAIVMGRAVLPPPATFDGGIMLVATLVHFALSIIYGLSVSWVIARLRAAPSLIVGAIFGLAVYGLNMYGFTAVFPWFEAARDWITIAAHLAFGIAAAGVYKMLSQRQYVHAQGATSQQ
jgi:hypothetical protein